MYQTGGLSVSLLLLLVSGPEARQEPENDIDRLMEEVLENRDINWDQFYNYFFTEREELELEGSLPGVPLHGFRHEHAWFIRDGYLVRSPLSADGVGVSAKDRAKAEKEWIEGLKENKPQDHGVDRRTFFGFDFEPGNYYYAGRQEFEGREVLVIEYYPSPDASTGGHEEGEVGAEESEERRAEMTIAAAPFVTMLVDPEERQLLRMTLGNASNMGFAGDLAPPRWLVQIETIEASMTMHQPYGDVWLVRDIEVDARVNTAGGDLGIRYRQTFYDYTDARTSATFRFPARRQDQEKR